MAREPFNRIWVENAAPPQFEEPDDNTWEDGWLGGAAQNPPQAKWENWWHNRVDNALQDIERNGAIAWHTDVPYTTWALALGSDGAVYIAVQDNQSVDPTADDGTNWLSLTDFIKSVFSASGPAPVFAIRAWGNFGGMGGVTLNASGNASVSYISNGRYQVAFDTPLEDEHYSVSLSGLTNMNSGSVSLQDGLTPYDYQSTGFKIETRTAPDDVNDLLIVNFQVVR